jgi:hypothetical protein
MNTPPMQAPPDYWPEDYWKEETELEEGWVPKTTHAEYIDGWALIVSGPQMPRPVTLTACRIRDGPRRPITSLGQIKPSYL